MRAPFRAIRPLAAALLATAVVLPVAAQTTGGAMIGTGPGTATAARVVTSSATVTAIDMATRQVTLRRADGSTFSVVAGDEVRNLPQLRVGDTVTLDYVDTLTLDLKKGGTGAPASRTETVAGTRAAAGQRPGGGAAVETTIVADVVAVDAAKQTVSLRGPQGRVVVLPVRDPEQFKRVAVGDQVQATYVEAVALSVTPAPAPAPAAAAAATPSYANWRGGWMFGLRGIGIYPDDSSSIDNLTVGSAWTAELDFSYFFNRNFAVEVIAATAKHAVRLDGNEIGKVGVLPPTVTFQWHFSDFGAFKPYVGAGFNYTYFYDRELANNTLTIQRDSWGGAVQVGADYFFAPRWSVNFDVKYIWMDTDVRTVNGGVEVGTVDINPVVWGIGVRYLF